MAHPGQKLVNFITNHKKTVIGAIFIILSAAVAFINEVIDLGSKIVPSESNMIVSPLSGSDHLSPLDGYPVLTDEHNKKIFAGGFKVSMTLTHNKKGNSSILVRDIHINVENYEPTSIPKLSYKVDSSKVYGQGFAIPNIFRVSLLGTDVGKAKWIHNNKPVKSEDENILNTNPPRRIKLDSAHDDIEEIIGTIIGQDPGYYEVSFSFVYHIKGRDYKYKTEKISLYVN